MNRPPPEVTALLPDGAVFLPISTGKRCTVKSWNRLTAAEAEALPQWKAAVAAAVRLDGLTVVDIDAPERRAEILAELGLTGATTLEAATPRGGSHMYFASERQQKSADGFDIKAGSGGYVLVCRFDGGGDYTFDGAPVAHMPASYRNPGHDGPGANGAAPRKPSTTTEVIRAPEKIAKLREELERVYGIELRERSGQLEGPCPRCKAGDDRFRIAAATCGKLMVQCRRCGPGVVYPWLEREFADAADDAVTVPCTRVRPYVPAPPAVVGDEHVRWGAVTLAAEPPPPPEIVAADASGQPLLRGGQVVYVYGDPFSGKSWAALALAAAATGRALLVCYERGDETRRRLHGMFASDETLRARVGVLSRIVPADFPAWAEVLDAGGPGSVVVIDSAGRSGCPIDGANVQPWLDVVVEPWIDPHRTVVVIDHTPRRDGEAGRNAGPIGSQSKTGAADVQYHVDADPLDQVGRLVATTLTDTGGNAMWHPRTINVKLKRGVPTAAAGEAARKLSFEEASAAQDMGTSASAAADLCGMKRGTYRDWRKRGGPPPPTPPTATPSAT